jgi:transposase
LTLEQFEEIVLPHLHLGSRGPQPKLSLHTIFNYILKLLYLGCPWKELPIENNKDGRPEIHYTRIYSAFRRFEAQGCFDAIFAESVSLLHWKGQLDISVIHGDRTTTAAKKGGDNLGYSGHKHLKGDNFGLLHRFGEVGNLSRLRSRIHVGPICEHYVERSYCTRFHRNCVRVILFGFVFC